MSRAVLNGLPGGMDSTASGCIPAQKMRNPLFNIFDRLIILRIHFFTLERLHETLRCRVGAVAIKLCADQAARRLGLRRRQARSGCWCMAAARCHTVVLRARNKCGARQHHDRALAWTHDRARDTLAFRCVLVSITMGSVLCKRAIKLTRARELRLYPQQINRCNVARRSHRTAHLQHNIFLTIPAKI